MRAIILKSTGVPPLMRPVGSAAQEPSAACQEFLTRGRQANGQPRVQAHPLCVH